MVYYLHSALDTYRYSEDHLLLQRRQPALTRALPLELTRRTSSLWWHDWTDTLANHPDPRFVGYIADGIRYGFRIEYDYSAHTCRRAQHNIPSALEHPEVIRNYLVEECAMGRILGLFAMMPISNIQISPLGMVPKKGHNKWYLILDFSSPEGFSVNDGISPDLCSLSYITVDDAAEAVTRMGRGALLAKVDIKNTYRMVEVHPEDRLLLGMQFEGRLFVDSVLPFGLRSAPKIFTAVADALEWIVRRAGVETLLHYLDDFLVVARPASSQCQDDLRVLLEIFSYLHVPVAEDKLEGPATSLTFLGIELDTEQMVLRLPPEKLIELRALLSQWHSRRYCRMRDLKSLVGKLQHASKIIRPGRTFLRRMFDLLKGTRRHQPLLHLNAAFRSDLAWWHTFLEHWNGVSMFPPSRDGTPDHHLFTDAAGAVGCGAWSGSHWFQYLWPEFFC